ncbi:MAG: hypothetical protein MUO88_18630 [Desulfobacterales bacterium]|nr:hypothetical protein [Desulfobacterales bacterium]
MELMMSMKESNQGLFPAYKIWMNAKAVTSRLALSTIATEISAKHISIRTNKPILPKTRVTLSFESQEKVKMQGNVAWVLDTQTDDGDHFYLTGIETDFIINQNIKAEGLAEKSRLLQDILFEIMVRSQN